MRKMCYREFSWKLLYAFLIIALTFIHCDAFTVLIPPDPVNPGKCVHRGDEIEVGTNITVPPCQHMYCNEDGSILVKGCGKLRFPNCNGGERLNTDKPYPECCVIKYKCKEDDGTPYYIDKDVSDEVMNSNNEA